MQHYQDVLLLKYIRFIFLPLFLGELYWKTYLPIWPLLSHWCCISSPLPPRHSFCVPGTEERSWMSALPSGSVLWQACYGSALRRCPLSRRVNTFALVLIQWEDFMFFTLLYWLVWAEGDKSKYFLAFRRFLLVYRRAAWKPTIFHLPPRSRAKFSSQSCWKQFVFRTYVWIKRPFQDACRRLELEKKAHLDPVES